MPRKVPGKPTRGLSAEESFDEDDLYAAMDLLNGKWVALEKRLYQNVRAGKRYVIAGGLWRQERDQQRRALRMAKADKLGTEFIHSGATELRWEYEHVALPATLSRNGLLLVSIAADGTLTPGAGVTLDPSGGKKVDLEFQARAGFR